MDEAHSKLRKLNSLLKEMESVVVAFSGGTDSSLLLKAAIDSLGEKAIAATAVSPSYSESEFREAKKTAEAIGARHFFVESKEMERAEYVRNEKDRCFYCKDELYSLLTDFAKKEGFNFVADGSNADDDPELREGMKAAESRGIRSPLREAGLTKQEIRALSLELNLPTWAKPAEPCLSSRIAYGTPVTLKRLSAIEKSEQFLKQLGFRTLRVRHHDPIARIEVLPEEFEKVTRHSKEITDFFKSLGFTYVTLDLQGYRSGSLHEVFLNGPRKTA